MLSQNFFKIFLNIFKISLYKLFSMPNFLPLKVTKLSRQENKKFTSFPKIFLKYKYFRIFFPDCRLDGNSVKNYVICIISYHKLIKLAT